MTWSRRRSSTSCTCTAPILAIPSYMNGCRGGGVPIASARLTLRQNRPHMKTGGQSRCCKVRPGCLMVTSNRLCSGRQITYPCRTTAYGALRRLEHTDQALRRNPTKAKKYKETMDNYIAGGHARKLTDTEVSGKKRQTLATTPPRGHKFQQARENPRSFRCSRRVQGDIAHPATAHRPRPAAGASRNSHPFS